MAAKRRRRLINEHLIHTPGISFFFFLRHERLYLEKGRNRKEISLFNSIPPFSFEMASHKKIPEKAKVTSAATRAKLFVLFFSPTELTYISKCGGDSMCVTKF